MTLEYKKEPIVKVISPVKHQGQIYGMLSNGTGDGVLELGEGFALKIIRLNETFLQLVLLDYGKDIPIPKQNYIKSKKVIEKKVVYKKPKKVQKTFTTDDKVEKKSIFNIEDLE